MFGERRHLVPGMCTHAPLPKLPTNSILSESATRASAVTRQKDCFPLALESTVGFCGRPNVANRHSKDVRPWAARRPKMPTFLEMPPEMRLRIYEYYFAIPMRLSQSTFSVYDTSTAKPTHELAVGLLSVNRRFRCEAAKVCRLYRFLSSLEITRLTRM